MGHSMHSSIFFAHIIYTLEDLYTGFKQSGVSMSTPQYNIRRSLLDKV